MYRSCIFCSAALGSNDSIEHFPVGRTLSFDAAKGRLWAVCPKCARWNLAPIEERWEAIEEAEKQFRDTRLRAQSENIGLARLRDGTRLVRVGKARSGELALWRYGESLVQRRRRALLFGGAGLVVAGGVVAGTLLVTAGALGGAWTLVHGAGALARGVLGARTLANVSAAESGDGRPARIRRKHIAGAELLKGGRGGLGLKITRIQTEWLPGNDPGFYDETPRNLVLHGAVARRVLSRGMVVVNARGARRGALDEAVQAIARAGSASEYLRRAAIRGGVLGQPRNAAELLALEMALHEESERTALEGELAELEAAWRHAEEIAGIADALPDGVPAPEPPRFVRRG